VAIPFGWINNATWYGGRPRLRRHCVRRGPSSPLGHGHSSPHFSARVLWPNGRPSQHCLLFLVILLIFPFWFRAVVTFSVHVKCLIVLYRSKRRRLVLHIRSIGLTDLSVPVTRRRTVLRESRDCRISEVAVCRRIL